MKLVGIFFASVAVFQLLFLSLPQVTQAASLYIDPAMGVLNRGDIVSMAVRVDVDEEAGECVNAIDAVVTYSENIEPVDVSIGDSILRVWVESPTINREDRTITFAGGIPNGYCGRVAGDPRLTNVLTEIIFQSPGFTVGGGGTTATIGFASETAVYLNDGFGTKAELAAYPATINLDPSLSSTLQNPWREEVLADAGLPDEFSISLQQEEKAFSGKYYIIFSTTDKQTGIDHYEVMEEPLTQFGAFQWGRADAPWVEARSPYVLSDQSLNSIIRVKAIDKAGNEYLATLIPDETLRTLSATQVMMIAGGVSGLVLLLVLLVVIRKVWKRRRATIQESHDEDDI